MNTVNRDRLQAVLGDIENAKYTIEDIAADEELAFEDLTPDEQEEPLGETLRDTAGALQELEPEFDAMIAVIEAAINTFVE